MITIFIISDGDAKTRIGNDSWKNSDAGNNGSGEGFALDDDYDDDDDHDDADENGVENTVSMIMTRKMLMTVPMMAFNNSHNYDDQCIFKTMFNIIN